MILAGSTKEFILNKEQEACVVYDGGDLLVRGVAGSGKSLVLMKRAVLLNKKAIEEKKKIRIGIFTFTNTLVQYTRELIDLTSIKDDLMIEIDTLDTYCLKIYRSICRDNTQLINDKTKDELISLALQKHYEMSKEMHRFYKVDISFWKDEFKWIKEKRLRERMMYIGSDRIGRGGKIRMSMQDKSVAYGIFVEYEKLMAKYGYFDWEDYYEYVIENIKKVDDSLYYDYILVDEAQDLSLVKLLFAKAMTRKAITIAADQAQKIFNTSFSWQDIGINIKGKGSKSLGETFRSTKQIIQLADNIISRNKNRLSAFGEYTEPVLPDKEGPKPIVIKCSDALNEKDVIQKTIIELIADRKSVVGIICRTRTDRSEIIGWLNEKNIQYEIVEKKSQWSLQTPGVKIIIMHSSKGLEVDTVIIPHFDYNTFPLHSVINKCDKDQEEELISKERSLLYVGMTRARQNLLITFSGTPSRFIKEMDTDLYDMVYNDPLIIGAPVAGISTDSNIGHVHKKIKKKSGDSVDDGDIVTAVTDDSVEHKFFIDLKKFKAQHVIVGKRVGDKFVLNRREYIVMKIE